MVLTKLASAVLNASARIQMADLTPAPCNIKLSDLEGLDLENFDPAEYITSDEAAAAYITQALATNDATIPFSAVLQNACLQRAWRKSRNWRDHAQTSTSDLWSDPQ